MGLNRTPVVGYFGTKVVDQSSSLMPLVEADCQQSLLRNLGKIDLVQHLYRRIHKNSYCPHLSRHLKSK
jgi:hypothetical protein